LTYCTAADVRTIVDTGLTDAEIAGIIESSDAEIERRVGPQEAGGLARKLSMLLTASTIRKRQPSSQAVGDYREEQGGVQEEWRREIEGLFRLLGAAAISSSGYGHLDERKRYGQP
jgi:hypothetical protein